MSNQMESGITTKTIEKMGDCFTKLGEDLKPYIEQYGHDTVLRLVREYGATVQADVEKTTETSGQKQNDDQTDHSICQPTIKEEVDLDLETVD